MVRAAADAALPEKHQKIITIQASEFIILQKRKTTDAYSTAGPRRLTTAPRRPAVPLAVTVVLRRKIRAEDGLISPETVLRACNTN